jgi:hypothetical protein
MARTPETVIGGQYLGNTDVDNPPPWMLPTVNKFTDEMAAPTKELSATSFSTLQYCSMPSNTNGSWSTSPLLNYYMTMTRLLDGGSERLRVGDIVYANCRLCYVRQPRIEPVHRSSSPF